MNKNRFDAVGMDLAWCPGCGNFSILKILKRALTELDLKPEELVVVSGIGQAAKIPHYFKTHFFNGLHGRALPPATAIKAVNPDLTVLAESGDGDMYGEGGNHFLHAVRRNPDITNIVHNNMVYGLTKGQASPTSLPGFKTPVQVRGVFAAPFNPPALAIALDASFVARAFSGDEDRTVDIVKRAISHRGYALVDLMHPCVSFNRVNTFSWFKENTFYLDDKHNIHDRIEAFTRAVEQEKIPLGVFYTNPKKKTFVQSLGLYAENSLPLSYRTIEREPELSRWLESRRNGLV